MLRAILRRGESPELKAAKDALDAELDQADATVLKRWEDHVAEHGVGDAPDPAVFRSLREIEASYRDELTGIVEGAGDLRGAGAQMRALIRRYATTAYLEGLRDGGVDAEELDEADREAIDAWTAGQLSHVRPFIEAVLELGQDTAILNRIEMWVNALNGLGGQAYLSTQRNKSVTWQMGETEEHCETCRWLHGQTHRASWFTKRGYIPREPASEVLDCGGWGCGCTLVDREGNVVV